jgi:hypothetical protein
MQRIVQRIIPTFQTIFATAATIPAINPATNPWPAHLGERSPKFGACLDFHEGANESANKGAKCARARAGTLGTLVLGPGGDGTPEDRLNWSGLRPPGYNPGSL